MGKKLMAAKTSIVAAFLAAGGATAAQAKAAAPQNVNWGDQLIRFLKLDGLPSYLKLDGSAQLAMFYKDRLLSDATALYQKEPKAVDDVLALYQKQKSDLSGILIGLSQFYKEKNIEPLLDYLKSPGAMDAYIKFESFFSALRRESGEGGAFDFFYKETGIAGDPLQQRQTDLG